MRAPRLVLFLVLLSLAVPGSVGTPPDLSQPIAAVAFVQPGGAIVAWTPGAVAPDHYVIYGVQGNTMLPISIAPPDETIAEVTGTYPQYAIAAVVDGTPSEATVAAALSQGCIIIETNPPGVSVGCGVDGLGGKVGVQIEVNSASVR